jgi:predicted PurR-regulated permease PerM
METPPYALQSRADGLMDPILPARLDTVPLDRGTTRSQKIARGALSLGLLLLGLYTLHRFLTALVWAAIFAIALWPLYRRLQAQCGAWRHNMVLPALFTLAVALIFIVPVGLVGVQLAQESHAAAEWVRQAQEDGIPEPDILHRIPYGDQQISAWWQANLADPGSAKALLGRTLQGRMGHLSRDIGVQVARRLTLFVFTLMTLFFLFRDGPRLAEQMRRASTHAFGPGGERVGRQIIASVHGTVNGLVLVGLGEGVLLGIVYALAGVPHPTVFGALTAVAAMIPFAAPVVFAVATLLLVANGSLMTGVIVFVIGMATTFTADHFIRPVLVGATTRLPFLWVLLGILGGVEVWGLLGLFLGPAIMSALILIWREYVGEAAPPA